MVLPSTVLLTTVLLTTVLLTTGLLVAGCAGPAPHSPARMPTRAASRLRVLRQPAGATAGGVTVPRCSSLPAR